MANLTPADSFDNVLQLETTDVVVGGVGGKSNVQAQQLLNRTAYLKAKQDEIRGSVLEQLVVTNLNFAITEFGKLHNITLDGPGSYTLTLPAIAGLVDADIGKVIRFKHAGQFDDVAVQYGTATIRVKCNAAESKIVNAAASSIATTTGIVLFTNDILELKIGKTGSDFFYFVSMRYEDPFNGITTFVADDSGINYLESVHIGQIVRVNQTGSTFGNFVGMPSAAGFPGKRITLTNRTATPGVIVSISSALPNGTIQALDGTTAVDLDPGTAAEFISDGVDKWYQLR